MQKVSVIDNAFNCMICILNGIFLEYLNWACEVKILLYLEKYRPVNFVLVKIEAGYSV